MINLRIDEPDLAPNYMTRGSAGADLRARISARMEAGARAKVPTGIWIASVDWTLVPPGCVPELQIRARSSLAWKAGVMLANGVGTVDCDFPDEICVLLWNSSATPFTIERGDRIAQIVLQLVPRLPGLQLGGERLGGFGSTGGHRGGT